jgi:Cro/C1-type HTH DNA-binding domain
MVQAFSQLKRVLGERRLSVQQLQRRLEEHGLTVNLKSLYRLAKDDQPLERLNLRVAGMICQVCDVPLSRLIAFELAETRLRRLSTAKQKRLDALMDKNNEGLLTSAERKELKALVRDAEEIALSNARKLAGQRRSLTPLDTDESR